MKYSALSKYSSATSNLAEEIHLVFDDQTTGERAFVKIRLYKENQLGRTPEVSVMLFGIPLSDQGQEVIMRLWC